MSSLPSSPPSSSNNPPLPPSPTREIQLQRFLANLNESQRKPLKYFKSALEDVFDGDKEYLTLFLTALKSLQTKVFPSIKDIPELSWIHYMAPLVKEEQLFHLVQQWKKENGPSFDFEAICSFFFARCFQFQMPIIDTSRVRRLLNHLAPAFEAKYAGQRAELFNSLIENHWNEVFSLDKYYSPCVPLVQSSGCGKSRLVHQLEQFWPTLSVCLRKVDATIAQGYPPPDIPAVVYLINQPRPSPEQLDPHLVVAAFIAAWLQEFDRQLRGMGEQLAEQDIPSLMSSWEYLQRNSQDPESSESSTAKPRLSISRNDIFQSITLEADSILELFDASCDTDFYLLEDPDEKTKVIAQKLLLPYVKPLCESLMKNKQIQTKVEATKAKKGIVYMAIDESSMLDCSGDRQVRDPDSAKSHRQLIQFLRLFQSLELCCNDNDLPFRFWLILIDTNSSITRLVSPPKARYPSNRQKSMTVIPPFYHLGFDTLLHLQGPIKKASDVLLVNFLKYYGRPLWASYAPKDVIGLAEAKLYLSKRPDLTDINQLLVVLSYTLCIDISSNHSGYVIAKTAVERHMRVLTQCTDETITTKALSEPLLAIAASSILRQPGLYVDAISSLATVINSQSIDLKGNNGKLFVRLLLHMAKDAAYLDPDVPKSSPQKKAKTDDTSDTELSIRAISIRKFLSQLVSAPLDMIELPEQGWINMTHFVVLTDEIECISASYLWHLFRRGVALQCAQRQFGVDGIIPVYVGKLDETFPNGHIQDAPGHMTFIAWQAKNRNSSSSSKHVYGPHIVGSDRVSPLTLFHEIGMESTFKDDLPWKVERQERSHPPILKLRGILNRQIYPCLDRFNAREVFSNIVQNAAPKVTHDVSSFLAFGDCWSETNENGLLNNSEISQSERDLIQKSFCM